MFQVPGRNPAKIAWISHQTSSWLCSSGQVDEKMRRWQEFAKFFHRKCCDKMWSTIILPQKKHHEIMNQLVEIHPPKISPHFPCCESSEATEKAFHGKWFPFATCKFGPQHQPTPKHQLQTTSFMSANLIKFGTPAVFHMQRLPDPSQKRRNPSSSWKIGSVFNAAAKGLNFGMVGCWLLMREGWGNWVIFFVERQTDVRNGHQ